MPAASVRVLAAGAAAVAVVGAVLTFNPGSDGGGRLETAVKNPVAASTTTAPDSPIPPALSVPRSETTTPIDRPASNGEPLGSSEPATEDVADQDLDNPSSAENGVGDQQAAAPPASAPPARPPASAPANRSNIGPSPGGSTERFESIRNRQDRFSRYTSVPTEQLSLGALTESAPRPDNGSSPEGQFRVACEYSHFGTDDPIVFPGQPGAAHLHMFFGNTLTNASTTEDQLLNTGGGTCSGFELNRSAYWTPALLDGKGNTVVPDAIILYYKTKFPGEVSPMPQGLQMLAGNFDRESFQASDRLHWSCGGSGAAYNKTDRIPDCGGDYINATIQFPSCWDGRNLGAPDFVSHLDFGSDHEPCPSSHPVRLPRISILLYFPGVDSVDGWRLSSDETSGFNGPPGGTLHADWWGAWNDEAMNLWINGCMRASRNCSFGQTGTALQLAGVSNRDVYEGNNFLPLP